MHVYVKSISEKVEMCDRGDGAVLRDPTKGNMVVIPDEDLRATAQHLWALAEGRQMVLDGEWDPKKKNFKTLVAEAEHELVNKPADKPGEPFKERQRTRTRTRPKPRERTRPKS